MPFCAAQTLAFASGLYQSVNSPSSYTVAFVSGWVTTSGNLGDLNNKLGTSFYLSGDSPCIAGGFEAEEQAIYQMMYQTQYYTSAALSVLAAGGTTPWVELREGDTTVRRTSAAEMSKAYMALKAETEKDLRLAIHDYKLRITVPQQVQAASLASFPTP